MVLKEEAASGRIEDKEGSEILGAYYPLIPRLRRPATVISGSWSVAQRPAWACVVNELVTQWHSTSIGSCRISAYLERNLI